AFQHFVRHGGSDRAGVVMQANALELQIFAVEGKAPGRVKRSGADAKRSLRFVKNFAVGNNFADGVMQFRIVEVPELRIADNKFLRDFAGWSAGLRPSVFQKFGTSRVGDQRSHS